MSSGHPRGDAADRGTPVDQPPALPKSPGGYGRPLKSSRLNDRHHLSIYEYSIFEYNARFFERNLSIDETISENYNSLTSQCAFVLRQFSGLSVDSNKWNNLRVKLSDLLTEMEAAAQEVCPENVEHIRNFSQLMFHPQQQAVAFSAVSSEVTKRGRGRPRKPVEITIPLAPPSPVTGYDGSLRPLPDKAPEIFLERKDKSENPIQFLNRVYGYWLDSGGFHIEDLNKLDRRLAPNLRSYCQQKKLNPQDFLPPPSPPKSAEEILAERRERNRISSAARYTRLKWG